MINSLGKDVLVVGFDGNDDVIKVVKEGKLGVIVV